MGKKKKKGLKLDVCGASSGLLPRADCLCLLLLYFYTFPLQVWWFLRMTPDPLPFSELTASCPPKQQISCEPTLRWAGGGGQWAVRLGSHSPLWAPFPHLQNGDAGSIHFRIPFNQGFVTGFVYWILLRIMLFKCSQASEQMTAILRGHSTSMDLR